MRKEIKQALKGKKYVVFFIDMYDGDELVWRAGKRYMILDNNENGDLIIENELSDVRCAIEYNNPKMYLV